MEDCTHGLCGVGLIVTTIFHQGNEIRLQRAAGAVAQARSNEDGNLSQTRAWGLVNEQPRGKTRCRLENGNSPNPTQVVDVRGPLLRGLSVDGLLDIDLDVDWIRVNLREVDTGNRRPL